MKLARHVPRRVIVWWRRLVVMTRKEMLQLSRDLPIGLLLVYSFTLAVYIAGNGIRSQLHNASLLVHDNDHSFSSRELIHKFNAPFFRLDGEIDDPQEGLRLLDRGKAMAVLEIPPRFHEQVITV
jgi:ABC-2 type transport system permease protein